MAMGFFTLKRSVAASAIVCGMLSGCASTEQHGTQASLSPAQANVPQPQAGATAVADASLPGVAAPGTAAGATADLSQGQATLAKTGRLQPAQAQVAQAQQAQALPGTAASIEDRMGPAAGQQAANQGQAAIAAATGAGAGAPSTAAAYANSDEAVAVAIPTPNPTRPEEAAAMRPATLVALADESTMPLTPAVIAIPIPNPSRPGEEATMRPVSDEDPSAQSPIPLTPEMVAIQSVVPTPRPGEAAFTPATEVALAAPVPELAYASAQPHYELSFDTSGPTVVPAVMTYKDDNNDDAVSPTEKNYISKLIAKYAKIYEVPADLIHRVVHRESRYNPHAYSSSGGYFGLMQIKYNTAKSMGYDGPPSGLFDAETNIKYAAKYLRGAWMVADSKRDDAVALYARGYYYDAKRKGMTDIANGDY